MTTPDISIAAVAAAHAAVALCHEDHPYSAKTPWACCIESGLAAALPHLGDTRTEYGIECDGPEGRRFIRAYERDRDFAASLMPTIRHLNPQLVQRPVWRGEWTEAVSE